MNDASLDNEKSLEQINSRQALGRLLNDMISFPDRRAEIALNIEDTFGQCKAVLTLDYYQRWREARKSAPARETGKAIEEIATPSLAQGQGRQ